MTPEPKFTTQLSTPTTVRRCIRCAQPITFDWEEYPVIDNRRSMTVVATFFAHPSTAACDAELERARRLDHGEIPTATDIGLLRAQMLRALATTAQDAMLAALEPDPEPAITESEDAPNPARQTRGNRQRRGAKPYGGLL
jgi:hypothetical protein